MIKWDLRRDSLVYIAHSNKSGYSHIPSPTIASIHELKYINIPIHQVQIHTLAPPYLLKHPHQNIHPHTLLQPSLTHPLDENAPRPQNPNTANPAISSLPPLSSFPKPSLYCPDKRLLLVANPRIINTSMYYSPQHVLHRFPILYLPDTLETLYHPSISGCRDDSGGGEGRDIYSGSREYMCVWIPGLHRLRHTGETEGRYARAKAQTGSGS